LFVGYQSVNTVGWQLLQGAAEVKLFGERIAVNAEIAQLRSVSGHADDNGLLRWAAALEPKPTRIFVNHGDEGACERLAERLRTEQEQAAEAPYSGDAWDLIANAQVEFGSRRRLVAKARKASQRGTTVYERLLAMAARLMRLVESFGGRANKDIAKLTAQIQTLCEKWEK
jgi:metallo-beta-lactamase family protein